MKGFTKGKGSSRKFIPTSRKKSGLASSKDLFGLSHDEVVSVNNARMTAELLQHRLAQKREDYVKNNIEEIFDWNELIKWHEDMKVYNKEHPDKDGDVNWMGYSHIIDAYLLGIAKEKKYDFANRTKQTGAEPHTYVKALPETEYWDQELMNIAMGELARALKKNTGLDIIKAEGEYYIGDDVFAWEKEMYGNHFDMINMGNN